MNEKTDNKNETKKKSSIAKFFEKIDKKMQEKAKSNSCCCKPSDKEKNSCCG